MSRPNVRAITGWQADRRQAVALLNHQYDMAMRRNARVEADAYWSAAWDIETILRDRATAVITESMTMPYAHISDFSDLLRPRGLQ